MILNTCFCVDMIRETARNDRGPARDKLASLDESDSYISLFTLCELRAGAELSRHPKLELSKIEQISSYMNILYPAAAFAVFYGETEAYLRKAGAPIPVMDLLIAVTAKLAGMPILTRDSEHFDRIPGIVVVRY